MARFTASPRLQRLRNYEKAFRVLLYAAAAVTVLTTLGILVSLAWNTFEFFRQVPFLSFLFGTVWTPLFANPKYGVLPLVTGTLLVAVGAALISIPIGLGSAVFLSEYASRRVRAILKPLLELLAGIPSIVYGFFALTTITPFLRSLIPSMSIFNAASASIAIGIMTIPLVASLSEDAMSTVPDSLRHGAYALGTTKFEVVSGIVIPASMSGIFASFILAVSRAIGETMIVALAAGAKPSLTLDPLQSVQTLTAFIAQASMGDIAFGTTGYYSLYAVAFLLFLVTMGMNLVSHSIIRRQRKVWR